MAFPLFQIEKEGNPCVRSLGNEKVAVVVSRMSL
jgi:hypothetical protein